MENSPNIDKEFVRQRYKGKIEYIANILKKGKISAFSYEEGIKACLQKDNTKLFLVLLEYLNNNDDTKEGAEAFIEILRMAIKEDAGSCFGIIMANMQIKDPKDKQNFCKEILKEIVTQKATKCANIFNEKDMDELKEIK